MYSFFVRLFCVLIPFKVYRRHIRAMLLNYPDILKMRKDIKEIRNYHLINEFDKYLVKEKSVLIVEVNDFHGITLPGNHWKIRFIQDFLKNLKK